jgi:glycosyltransferase involved in cell wall biosynthesis
MFALVKRWKLEAEDRLKYSPLVRGLYSRYQRWKAPRANGDQQALAVSIVRLCAAARFADSDAAVRVVQDRIHDRLKVLRPEDVDWTPFVDHVLNPQLPRGVLLKAWRGPSEKGVLFISFEKEWFKLLAQCDLKSFQERYTLVLAPSSSPHNLANYVFANSYPGKLFSLISNASDLEILPRVAPNLVPLPLYASQWVLPELFRPRPHAERDVDLIMVANFAKVKRHHALFAALRRLPRDFRVLLVGQDQDGRTADSVRREAAWYGVAERVTVESNVSYPGVTAALPRARASVILSRREGSCVVVAESLFADVPVGLLEDAEIGSRAFINPHTGVFLRDADLAGGLLDLVRRSDTFTARRWAEDNISCHRSTQALNDVLRRHALEEGQEWTEDLATLCWRPDPALVDPEAARRMQPERQEMNARFGLEVGPP